MRSQRDEGDALASKCKTGLQLECRQVVVDLTKLPHMIERGSAHEVSETSVVIAVAGGAGEAGPSLCNGQQLASRLPVAGRATADVVSMASAINPVDKSLIVVIELVHLTLDGAATLARFFSYQLTTSTGPRFDHAHHAIHAAKPSAVQGLLAGLSRRRPHRDRHHGPG
jgi:hypothetical protein